MKKAGLRAVLTPDGVLRADGPVVEEGQSAGVKEGRDGDGGADGPVGAMCD